VPQETRTRRPEFHSNRDKREVGLGNADDFDRRLPVRRHSLPRRRRPRRDALLPLPHVSSRARRPGGRLGHRAARGFYSNRRHPVAYRSSPKAIRCFCGRCGTPLTWESVANPALVDVGAATLDDPAAVAPAMHLWTESRISWFDTADDLPRHPTNERVKPTP